MRWDEFERACPELATLARERFVKEPEVRKAFRDAIRARIDWAPDEPNYHCLSLDVHEAAHIRIGDDPVTLSWDAQRGLRTLPNPG